MYWYIKHNTVSNTYIMTLLDLLRELFPKFKVKDSIKILFLNFNNGMKTNIIQISASTFLFEIIVYF